MPAGPPWNFNNRDMSKELIDQGLHILAAYSIFLVIFFVPMPWSAVILSLGIMIERERIQHKDFPRVGHGSRLDMTVWTFTTGIAAYIMRG